jgi:hypothetical protein
MTNGGNRPIRLHIWLSVGLSVVTVLVLAVALGLVRQSSSPAPSSGEPGPAATASTAAPSSEVIDRADRICRAILPDVLAQARRATTVARADELAEAARQLIRPLQDLADAVERETESETESGWPAALVLGRGVLVRWQAAVQNKDDAYARERRAGLELARRWQADMARLGATVCAA